MKRILLFVGAVLMAFATNAQDAVVATATEATQAITELSNATAAASDAAKATEAKPSPWKMGVDIALTGTQNFVSKNTSWSSEWYNGGNSSLSGLFALKSWFNYKGEQGLMWDNLVELKYGIGTNFSKDAAGRAWHLSDDKTSYSTKLGYAIGKGWNIAWNGDLTTTLFRNYSTISDNRAKMFFPVSSDLMSGIDPNHMSDAFASACVSPLRFTTGIGVDYKYENAAKNIELSVYIAPYAYKLVYVEDMTKFASIKDDGDAIGDLQISSISDVAGIGQNITNQAAYDAALQKAKDAHSVADFTTFYNELNNAAAYVNPNHHKSYNVGSLFDVQYRQKFNDNVSLFSRLQFYTDYKGIEVDWEITADFTLYKLLTARLSVNPRYDSTVAAPEGKTGWDIAKLQLKEFVSIGLAYRFEK
ncbi:MAG: DUF3078 domain-containing protein [Paludibacteraceae bacterium]|nr:DUF3078 domain-containing protein [Paludibacteraceae bacterium]